MKLFRIWYSTSEGESDFTECIANDENFARIWFRTYYCNCIESVEMAQYALL